MEDENIQWLRRGNTGCMFATILSKHTEKCKWLRIIDPKTFPTFPEDTIVLSFIFPDKNLDETKRWAIDNGFYIEDVGDGLEGLRYKSEHGVSWVQYFGPESHVKTRQSPQSELLFTRKLPKKYYYKVGFKGVLHLAHAPINYLHRIAKGKSDSTILSRLWDMSFSKTEKILGHKPTVREAAKTTFEK